MKRLWREIEKAFKRWLGKKLGDVVPGEEDAGAEGGQESDAMPYKELIWCYGGFKGAGAVLDAPRISNLNVQRNGMTLSWDVDLRTWGVAHGDHTQALACLFCRVDGAWRGGKFDWISSSRSSRDFKNVRSGYNGWKASDFDRADAYAFVVVHKDEKRRSNVITAGL